MDAKVRPAGRRRRPGLVTLVRFGILAGLLGLWQLGYRTGHIDPFSFSAPSLIWARLVKLFHTGIIWPHIAATGREAVIGLVIGFVAGVGLGFVAGLNAFVGRLLEPIMLLLRCSSCGSASGRSRRWPRRSSSCSSSSSSP
jgi:ABC-type nitrate/sulfonate/bicarbonate transport system permease component